MFLVNDRFCALLGYSRAELLQMRLQDITYAEDLPRSLELLQRLLETGGSFGLSKRYVCQDGTLLWANISVTLIQDANGQARHFQALLVDVTAQQRTAAQLRASEEDFRVLASTVPVGIFRTDAEGQCLYVNERWSQISGLTMEDATGAGWAKSLHPDDRALISAQWTEAVQTNRSFEAEYRFVNGDGQVTWVVGQAVTQRDDQGNVSGYIGTITDITDHKATEAALRESEEYLQAAITAAQAGTWRWDLNTNEVRWSPTMKMLMGYAPTPDLNIFHDWAQRVHPEDLQRIEAILPQWVQEGKAIDIEYRILLPETNEVRWLREFGRVAHNETGATVVMRGIALDITERKQIEATLQQANHDLHLQINERHAAEAQVKELLHRVVSTQEAERQRISRELHDELGQRLSALSLAVKAMENCLDCPSKATAQLARIQASIAALEENVDQLAFELHPPMLNNLGLAEALRQYTEDWMRRSGIPVDFQTFGLEQERLSLTAETALYRIAQEALTNILKHAQATQVGLILERRRAELRLIIEDNGQGFENEVSYTAAEASRKTGLRGMRERLALLHGTFTIEATPGQGTTIYASLPLKRGGDA